MKDFSVLVSTTETIMLAKSEIVLSCDSRPRLVLLLKMSLHNLATALFSCDSTGKSEAAEDCVAKTPIRYQTLVLLYLSSCVPMTYFQTIPGNKLKMLVLLLVSPP